MVHAVFHPNFDAASVCIGDFWAPSEGLDDLIIRIGRMIAYQDYNTKSPLNGLAAKWADENQHLLPVDPTEVAPPLERPAAAAPGDAEPAHRQGAQEQLLSEPSKPPNQRDSRTARRPVGFEDRDLLTASTGVDAAAQRRRQIDRHGKQQISLITARQEPSLVDPRKSASRSGLRPHR